MPRRAPAPKTPEEAKRRGMQHIRTAIKRMIWQAEFIGWPALAESFRRDVAALDAKRRR